MKPINNSTLAPLKVTNDNGEGSVSFHAQQNKVAWVQTKANKIGSSFDIVFRDALGREMMRRDNCHSETHEFGEMLNVPTRMGEDYTVSLENIKNAEEVEIFLN